MTLNCEKSAFENFTVSCENLTISRFLIRIPFVCSAKRDLERLLQLSQFFKALQKSSMIGVQKYPLSCF